MLKENAEVIKIENDGLWVRSQSVSVCHSCKAKTGCGQKLINRWTGEDFDVFAEFRDGLTPDHFRVADRVEIGISPNAVVGASLMVYGIPILVLVFSIAFFENLLGSSAWVFAAASLGAMLFSVCLVRALLNRWGPGARLQPWVVGKAPIGDIGVSEVIAFPSTRS